MASSVEQNLLDAITSAAQAEADKRGYNGAATVTARNEDLGVDIDQTIQV
jgi:hypothetical protein